MSYKNLSISVFIGGFLYFSILIFFSVYDYSDIGNFFAKNWVAGAFSALGMYFSIDKRNHQKKTIVFSLLFILLFHYLIQLIIYRDFVNAFNVDFFRAALFVYLCGHAVASVRLYNIQLKENLIVNSPEIVLEKAKTYRMNSFIRPAGIVVGVLFLLCPLLVAYELLTKTNDASVLGVVEVLLIFILMLGAAAMGAMFLAYCIPGKTPSFVLRHLEKRIHKSKKNA